MPDKRVTFPLAEIRANERAGLRKLAVRLVLPVLFSLASRTLNSDPETPGPGALCVWPSTTGRRLHGTGYAIEPKNGEARVSGAPGARTLNAARGRNHSHLFFSRAGRGRSSRRRGFHLAGRVHRTACFLREDFLPHPLQTVTSVFTRDRPLSCSPSASVI